MKVTILYRPGSEHQSHVLDYVRDYKRQRGKDLELLSLDTVEGAAKARLYDVVRYPAVIATTDDGQLLQLWQDGRLPLMNDIDFYTKRL